MSDKTFWGKFSDNFGELNTYVVGKETMDIILGNVEKLDNLGNVLELACGDGAYTRVLAKKADKILATDYSDDMVESSKRKLAIFDNVTVEQADAMNLKYEDESFDTIFMANLLHVVTDYEKIVENVYRLLKPNGRIIALDFTIHSMSTIEKVKLTARFIKTYGKPDEKATKPSFSDEDMRILFKNKGFEVEKSEIIGGKTKAVFGIGIKK